MKNKRVKIINIKQWKWNHNNKEQKLLIYNKEFNKSKRQNKKLLEKYNRIN